MALYERTKGGKVVERVRTVDGRPEDQRLAAATRDGKSGWRQVKTEADDDGKPAAGEG